MSIKKFILGTIIFTIIVILGFTSVNIVTTKALSPTGNGEDNYAMVSEEFGEDFEEFIKDNATVKIYTPANEEDNTTIKIDDKEFRIKKENPFIKVFSQITSKASIKFNSIKNKIDGKLKKENKEIKETNSKLDNIVDDFIKERENKESQKENINKSEENIKEDTITNSEEEVNQDENNKKQNEEEKSDE